MAEINSTPATQEAAPATPQNPQPAQTQNTQQTSNQNQASASNGAAQPATGRKVVAAQAAASNKRAGATARKAARKSSGGQPRKAAKTAKPVKTVKTAAKNVRKATRTAQRTAGWTAEQTLNAARKNANQFTALLNKNTFKAPYQQSMENLMANNNANFEKAAQQAAEASRQGVEAWVKSCNIWMRGCEDLVKTCLNIAQESTERNSNAFKSLLGCKTLNELTEAQNQNAQRNFDDLVNNATKISEISIKVATEAAAPLNEQVSQTVRKATQAA